MAPVVQKLPVRPLGSQGLKASVQGLGCMGFSFAYATNMVDDAGALNVIERAKSLGVTFLDTSDFYGPYTNERLLSHALAGSARKDFTLATKFANAWDSTGKLVVRGDPEHVREASTGSLKRLGVDYIDLYYQHRVDVKTPIEKTVAAMAELVRAGKVGYLGLSEVSAEDLRKAHAVHPISAVQLEWSLWTRDAEKEIIPTCRELGIAIVAYSPLGRGFLTGAITSREDLDKDDRRLQMPRFSEENFHKNLELVDKVKEVAVRHEATPGQVALAWLHAQGDDVFPIPGTKRVKYLEENVAAYSIKLTPQDLQELDAAFPENAALGGRYQPAVAAHSYNNYHKLREQAS